MEEPTRYKCQMKGCPFVSTIEAPVCQDHLEHIGRVYLETQSVAGSFMQMREAMQFRQALSLAEKQASASAQSPEDFSETVYYVRLGDHVKIGTTNDVRTRLRALYADHDPKLLLAVEPGGWHVEQARHQQFRDERVWSNRELFNPSPRLLDHIAGLDRQYGKPAA